MAAGDPHLPIEIHPIERADVELVRPLIDEFVHTHTRLSFRDDYWAACRDWLLRVAGEPEAIVLGARAAGNVAGLLTARVEENGPLLSPRKIGYIPLLVVSPHSRRQGIGRALWQTARDWLLAQGIHEVQLYTEAGNAVSGGFWERIGFSVFTERRKLLI